MSVRQTKSGIPQTTFRIMIKIIPPEQLQAEAEEADRAFYEDREIPVDPNIAYEADLDMVISHIIPFIERLHEIESEFRFYNA